MEQAIPLHNMDAADTTSIDRRILRFLAEGRDGDRPWGRSTPSKIAEEIDNRRQYVHQRLQALQPDLVTMHTTGVYEITKEGLDVVDELSAAETWGSEDSE